MSCVTNKNLRVYYENNLPHSELNVWKPFGICNFVNGTDGTQFKPFLTEDDQIWAFEPMLCRKLDFLSHHGNISMSNVEIKGIPTIRFVVTYENFARSLRNRCFCLEDSEDKCPAGALNLVACSSAQNVEVIASSPYFYTNPTLLNQSHLEMKHFSLNQYGTILDIEPVRKESFNKTLLFKK